MTDQVFQWAGLPKDLLSSMAAEYGADVDDAIAFLVEDYGPEPTDEFAREWWPFLRENWLRHDDAALAFVARWIWGNGHFPGTFPESHNGQVHFLRERRNAKTVREALIEALLITGTTGERFDEDPESTPSAVPHPVREREPRTSSGRQSRSSATRAGTANQSLEVALWTAADQLRNKMDAAEYKHVVLGLIFLKYVSDVFEARRSFLQAAVADPESEYFMPTESGRLETVEDRDEYLSEGVFWVPDGHRWTDLRAAAKQPDIGARLDAAMDAIEKDNPSLKGVLPKNYARRELTPETLGGLIDTFSREDLAAAEHSDQDVLGRVYEYFLGKFASNEGKLGGEFYTPRSVVQLLVEMLEPFNGRVFDPACGSGGMFVQADKFVRAHGGVRNDISVFGQEQNPTTWRLAKMNLALRGIDANLGPEWGDSFHDDKHPDLRADFILANPPFNISDWGGERLADDPRWKYGKPPASNANFAWIQHMLHHLAPTGTMATVLANGSLSSQQSGEGDIRRNLVEADMVECIVALPGQLFYTTQIPVCLWFLTKDKSDRKVKSEHPQRGRKGEVLFIDARSLGQMVSRTNKELSDDDIAKVADTYHAWRGEPGHDEYKDTPGFCAAVALPDIAAHKYVLTPGRYVGAEDIEDDGEPLDQKINRLRTEIRAGFAKRTELQGQVLAALDALTVSDHA